MTIRIWVARVSWRTFAYWQMINDITNSSCTAYSRAGIFTFVSYAGFVKWTVSIYNTFRSAGLVWVTIIPRLTNTSSGAIDENFTSSIDTTGCAITRILRLLLDNLLAWCKWISRESFFARTHYSMVSNCTYCIKSAWFGTRLYAFIICTCFTRWTIFIDRTFSFAIRWISFERRLAIA